MNRQCTRVNSLCEILLPAKLTRICNGSLSTVTLGRSVLIPFNTQWAKSHLDSAVHKVNPLNKQISPIYDGRLSRVTRLRKTVYRHAQQLILKWF